MGAFVNLKAGSVMSSLVLIVAPCLSAAYHHPYEDRLFLVADSNETFPNRKGFVARCAEEEKWFYEVTSEEVPAFGREVVVFAHDVREAQQKGASCFTSGGDFIGCALAQTMADRVDEDWVSCEITKFIEAQSVSPAPADDAHNFFGNQAILLVKEYPIFSIVGSVIITSAIITPFVYALVKWRYDQSADKFEPK